MRSPVPLWMSMVSSQGSWERSKVCIVEGTSASRSSHMLIPIAWMVKKCFPRVVEQ